MREYETREISLIDFTRDFWHVVEPGVNYVHGWHIEAICDHLTAVKNGQIRNLVISMPPRHMKSLIVSVFFPIWMWISKPSFKWLYASYGLTLSVRDSLKCRRLIAHPVFQSRYGHIFKLRGDQRTKTRFDNDKMGYRIATSVGGVGTGEGGDGVVCDDAHNVLEAESNAVRESTLVWWSETMGSRLNDPKTGFRIIVGQRTHELDLSAYVLSKNTYEHLCLPGEYEGVKRKTVIGWEDPRTELGEYLWPDRFGEEEMKALRNELGEYAYACQVMQSPAPREGGYIKHGWWGYFDPEFDDNENIINPNFIYILQAWDTAFKEGQNNDYSVCTTWGVNNTGAYLIDRFKEKIDFPKLLIKTKELGARYRPHKILIEDTAAGQSLYQTLKKETILPIKAVSVHGRDKEARLIPLTTYIESTRVFLRRNAPWVEDYKHNMGVFPNGMHDDDVDSTTLALTEIFHASRAKQLNNFSILGR